MLNRLLLLPVASRQPSTKDIFQHVMPLDRPLNVFIHSAAATPQTLLKDFTEYCIFKKVKSNFVSIHTEGQAPYLDNPDLFRVNSLFIGQNVRENIRKGLGDFTPSLLADIPHLFSSRIIPLDISLISVSPPNSQGYVSLGPSVDVSHRAIRSSPFIFAQVNKNIPFTFGDSVLHISHLDGILEKDEALPIHTLSADPISDTIAENCASLIEDGSCLQTGIGTISESVFKFLSHKRDLGVHTEMFSQSILPLIQSGVINNRKKVVRPGRIVSSFCMGDSHMWRAIDNNPLFEFKDIAWVNSFNIISKNPKTVSINSAIEIDLSGNINSDTILQRPYSGVGGAMDYVFGAEHAPGGKSIMALRSTTKKGDSKIVSALKHGNIVCTRNHTHYVVTEYGIADLKGKTLRQRARALIDISHPDHRTRLAKEYHNLTGILIS